MHIHRFIDRYNIALTAANAKENMLLYPSIVALSLPAEHAQADTISIWRSFSPNSEDRLYTKSCEEANQSQITYDCVYEGLGLYTVSDQHPSTLPLYRFFGQAEHFYADNVAEKTSVSAEGYIAEDIVGYIYPDPGENRHPLYRSFSGSSGTYFYTINKTEHDVAISKYGHRDEGISGYVRARVGRSVIYPLYIFPPSQMDLPNAGRHSVAELLALNDLNGLAFALLGTDQAQAF